MSQELDLLIRDGLIVDGTGRPSFRGSIGIKGSKITEIGELRGCRAEVEIDASKLVVSPGFVDIHSHADETLFLYPAAPSCVMQGVTTIIGGNCGFTPAPLKEWWLMSFWEYDWWHEISPFKYYPEILVPLDRFNEKLREKHGVEINWRSFNDYLKEMEEKGISVNYAPLVGHNTVRAAVMGKDYKREAGEAELSEMKTLVREAMEAGAHGLSTGLDYEPGYYAEISELIELTEVIKEYGGVYATHWRRTGLRRERVEFKPLEKINGIIEAIEVGRRTDVPVQISHITSGFVIYPPPPKTLLKASVKATIEYIESALREGLDVSFDVIPNIDGGVFSAPYLASLLAPWLRELGSRRSLSEALKMNDFRKEIREAINAGKWWGINPRINPYWMNKIKVIKCRNRSYVNKTIGEIARERSEDPMDALFKILIEDPDAMQETIYFNEEEVEDFVKHPAAMVCSDTFTFDEKWGMKNPPYYLPHPNTYGVYPRLIRKYVREKQVLTLEEAIKKITYMPARKLKLTGRGVIEVGAYADLVVFNYEALRDRGDQLEPRKYPEGIEYVIVNGRIVVERGKHTGIRSGKVIRRDEGS